MATHKAYPLRDKRARMAREVATVRAEERAAADPPTTRKKKAAPDDEEK